VVQPERQPDRDLDLDLDPDPDRSAPPPLPPVRANLAHIVIPTTALWFVGFVVLLFFTGPLREHDAMIWLWTCLAGWILGLMGLTIYFWQRQAARRGRRSANQMALEERLR
jgi:hypothetical protein